MAIGGADMPVILSMLNSYSGWAASTSGFILNNNLLIITGAIVGSSGAILSYVMCKAMNRSFFEIVLGGKKPKTNHKENIKIVGAKKHFETDTYALAQSIKQSESIIISPGYGMAVS